MKRKQIENPKNIKGLYSFVLSNARKAAREIYEVIIESPIDRGGWVFVFGPERSGKSLVAIYLKEIAKREGLKARQICYSQPLVDRPDVPKNKIFSRLGLEMMAVSFETKADIEKIFHENDVVIIDEIQFTPFVLQSYLLQEATIFLERGGWFVALGLLYNSQGAEFLISALLKIRSRKVYNLYSLCQMCGAKAYKYSQRLVSGKIASIDERELLPPSATVSYEPRCDECFVVKK